MELCTYMNKPDGTIIYQGAFVLQSLEIQKSQKMSNYRNFKDYHIEQLRDPEDAKIYLSVALEDYEQNGDIEAFLLAVRDVAEAQGGMSKLAERVSLTREGLYKALSENGNPQLNTMGKILYGLGFKFSIETRENKLQMSHSI